MQILLHEKCYITSIVGLFVLWINVNISKTQTILINTEYKNFTCDVTIYEFPSSKNTKKK